MPILEVEIVLKSGEVLPTDLAARIADAAARVFILSPGTTWAKVSAVPLHLYAEDGGGPPAGVHPVFVKVLRAHRPTKEELAAEVRRDSPRSLPKSLTAPPPTSTSNTSLTPPDGSRLEGS